MFPDLLRDDVFRLETRRLWLRWPQAADAGEIARLAGDEAVASPTARVPHPYPAGAADAFILQTRHENSAGEAVTYVLAGKHRPHAPIGTIGLTPVSDDRLELGYWLGKPFWRQGFMTEAARAVVELAFRWTPAREIAAAVRADNASSQKVLENCGFRRMGRIRQEGPARSEPWTADRFSLRREDWMEGTSAASENPQRDFH